MKKVAAASLQHGTGQPQQHPLCTGGNIINPRDSCWSCVVHNFLRSICWGKPPDVLIDKVRPTGALDEGSFLWTVLN